MVGDAFQIARVAFLELQPVETRRGSSLIPGFNKIPRDIDTNYFRPHPGQRKSRGAVSAAEVQRAQRRRDPERFNDCSSGLTHERRNLGEVTFFPQRLIRIHMISFLIG